MVFLSFLPLLVDCGQYVLVMINMQKTSMERRLEKIHSIDVKLEKKGKASIWLSLVIPTESTTLCMHIA